jgi:hypothetical protein
MDPATIMGIISMAMKMLAPGEQEQPKAPSNFQGGGSPGGEGMPAPIAPPITPKISNAAPMPQAGGGGGSVPPWIQQGRQPQPGELEAWLQSKTGGF